MLATYWMFSQSWWLETLVPLQVSPSMGCWVFLTWWLNFKSKHPMKTRHKLYHLLWPSLTSHVTLILPLSQIDLDSRGRHVFPIFWCKECPHHIKKEHVGWKLRQYFWKLKTYCMLPALLLIFCSQYLCLLFMLTRGGSCCCLQPRNNVAGISTNISD